MSVVARPAKSPKLRWTRVPSGVTRQVVSDSISIILATGVFAPAATDCGQSKSKVPQQGLRAASQSWL